VAAELDMLKRMRPASKWGKARVAMLRGLQRKFNHRVFRNLHSPSLD